MVYVFLLQRIIFRNLNLVFVFRKTPFCVHSTNL